ncbi:MAG: arsenate reductase/protein-tyrosine-phosphatase family protein, partial [Planctomycetota bacterium]
MTQVLFLCCDASTLSPMAAAAATALAPESVSVIAGGLSVGAIHPLAKTVMTEAGTPIPSNPSQLFSETSLVDVDIVVTLCDSASEQCRLLLPGQPTQVEWRLEDPAAGGGGEAEVHARFKDTRDRIQSLVRDFFEQGYYKALQWSNRKADLILSSLSEGIIIHDMNRTVLFFNGAAEAITGFPRHEVIGRDCHEVFGGNFCGARCSFCESGKPP